MGCPYLFELTVGLSRVYPVQDSEVQHGSARKFGGVWHDGMTYLTLFNWNVDILNIEVS